MTAHKLTAEHSLRFVLGGNATFTLRSMATGTRFTYKVEAPRTEDADTSTIFWVYVLTGSDNESSFTYLGFIKPIEGKRKYIHGGKKARVTAEATSNKAIAYTFNKYITNDQEPPDVEIWHEGKCCRCGRKLTVPESIVDGIGPDCKKTKSKKAAMNF